MPKVITVCPFSKMMCRECAIYRGRHAQMCLASRYQQSYPDAKKAKAKCGELVTKWEMPDIPDNSKVMVDIEDFIERRGI